MKKRLPALPRLTSSSAEISGRNEILVCGCTALRHYSDDKVVIGTPEGTTVVSGKKLVMRWAGYGKLLICGELASVTLE